MEWHRIFCFALCILLLAIFHGIIKPRLSGRIHQTLVVDQFGFRAGRGTRVIVLALCQILRKRIGVHDLSLIHIFFLVLQKMYCNVCILFYNSITASAVVYVFHVVVTDFYLLFQVQYMCTGLLVFYVVIYLDLNIVYFILL